MGAKLALSIYIIAAWAAEVGTWRQWLDCAYAIVPPLCARRAPPWRCRPWQGRAPNRPAPSTSPIHIHSQPSIHYSDPRGLKGPMRAPHFPACAYVGTHPRAICTHRAVERRGQAVGLCQVGAQGGGGGGAEAHVRADGCGRHRLAGHGDHHVDQQGDLLRGEAQVGVGRHVCMLGG